MRKSNLYFTAARSTRKPIRGAMCLLICGPVAHAQLGDPVANVDLGGFTFGGVTNVRANLISDISGREALTQLATAPGFDDSVFFAERSGAIYKVDLGNSNPATNFSLVGDVAVALGAAFGDGRSPDANSGDGMRGLAFHPRFQNWGALGAGKFYTVHEEVFNSGTANLPATVATDPNGRQDAVLTEWSYNPNNGTFLNNPREVLRAQMVDGAHPMQQIAFNPASQPGDTDYGMLYITVGDGGVNPISSRGDNPDPDNVVQSLDNPQGKILRINPLNSIGAHPYSIPTGPGGNVFGNDSEISTRAEIYAYGFRNPQTIGFDRRNGNLFVGDIGQLQIEEINLVENGGNYGWADREGTYVDGVDSGSGVVYDGVFQEVLPATRDADGYTYPVLQFSQVRDGVATGANAIVGGYVYDGKLASELGGQYLFGNLSADDIFYADASDLVNDNDPAGFFQLQLVDDLGDATDLGTLVGNDRTLMRFGQDADGEVYIFSQRTGQLFRLEGTERGDMNGDGAVTNADISAFVLALTDPDGYQATYPDLDPDLVGDFDGSLTLTNADIAGFVDLLTAPLSIEQQALFASIPEPGSAALFGLGGLLLMRRRR